jgi:hypothetical protein
LEWLGREQDSPADPRAGPWEAAGAPRRPPPPLGPLELADVAWGLAVCGVRTNGGAELRELYLRVRDRCGQDLTERGELAD